MTLTFLTLHLMPTYKNNPLNHCYFSIMFGIPHQAPPLSQANNQTTK